MPLVPTKYTPPPPPLEKPPKIVPRLKRIPKIISQAPPAIQEKVKNLIDEIAPYYQPETIREFRRKHEYVPVEFTITERSRALRGNVKSYEVPIFHSYDASLQLNNTKKAIFKLLKRLLKDKRGFKFNATLNVRLSKRTENGTITREPYFNAGPFTVTNSDQISESIDNAIKIILELIARWLSEGSGWVFELVLSHNINIVSYFPLRGTSYIVLPEELRHPKKGLINPKNEDNRCFLWCHNRYLNPLKGNPERITKADRESVKRLDYTGVTFPVTLSDMKRIEEQNKININVFGYDRGAYPIRISEAKFSDHMELLWITKEEADVKKYENSHYVLIKDFNRFMHSFTKYVGRKYFCLHCLHCCSFARVLEMHKQDCLAINGTQAIKMPVAGSKIYFKNHKKMLPAPFVIYADFEAITEKIDGCQPSDGQSYTTTYQSHKACSYGYKLVCRYDKRYSKPVEIYRGEDCIQKFIMKMLSEVKDCQRIVREQFQKPLVMTEKNERDFQNSTKCHICARKFNEQKPSKQKVRDHCHITGKYRGAAHSDCNLKWAISAEKLEIPVIFHNLKGYDCHFIMQNIGHLVRQDLNIDVDVIASNFEKYIGFNIGNHLSFKDSFSFMSQSLDRLSSNLGDNEFIYSREAFPNDEQFRLMKKKGVYPYDYMDSFRRFSEKSLPEIEDFYSILNDTNISESDYSHAKRVWSAFQIKDFGDYHDLYLRTDVLLLADVFESFRSTCLSHYRLDPCHYFSAPGLSWDALLRMTWVNLDLISDFNAQLFIEKGMRGGISTITHRHAVANNKYMKNYNPEVESSYLIYLDANNLYGWAMSQSLPVGDFKWIPSEDFEDPEDFILENYTNDTRKGVILEVDLEYPEELHDLHNDYPLAPEKILITDDMLSKYCKDLKDSENISSGRVHKLVPNLRNKEKYVLHYRNLQLYLSLGMKLTKIHRVLEFTQRPWMKRYIDFNTEKRKMAKNSFEKDFFKLMNNSVFGKTMENLRKRSNIKLETDPDHLLKLTRQPTYVSSKICDENLVGVQMKKVRLVLDKPSYVGFCILDMNKRR